MKQFLSCDWGTSSFRLRRVSVAHLEFDTIEERDKGIASVFELWKQERRPEADRFSFYLSFIAGNMNRLEERSRQSFADAPLVVSGMAASSIGMMELQYESIPFSAAGSDFKVTMIKATDEFKHDIIIVPGICTENDAARGEETQLIGCDHERAERRLFIFPGTHSKHILVDQGNVADITTYMTGEVFELLSQKSILSLSIAAGDGIGNERNKSAFKKGVEESTRSNLLHASFLVRINDLFKKLDKGENYFFLSGVLIGSELSDLLKNREVAVTVVASSKMKELYLIALDKIFPGANIRFEDADLALIKGQLKILRNLQGRH